ncbi:hypothetical protein AV530_016562 [Patagioenas fasciata monilis]|uniref:Uncharacterized protein n=1 Tax=Patagioenas fasciata monilis TaxID=372326 RepID=A0A1V4J424_PATFA|nr:hypothetical protein AV530_016562 [Patagioenas fasciata monilis]
MEPYLPEHCHQELRELKLRPKEQMDNDLERGPRRSIVALFLRYGGLGGLLLTMAVVWTLPAASTKPAPPSEIYCYEGLYNPGTIAAVQKNVFLPAASATQVPHLLPQIMANEKEHAQKLAKGPEVTQWTRERPLNAGHVSVGKRNVNLSSLCSTSLGCEV